MRVSSQARFRCPVSWSTSSADPTFTTMRRADPRGEEAAGRCADMVRKLYANEAIVSLGRGPFSLPDHEAPPKIPVLAEMGPQVAMGLPALPVFANSKGE